MCSSILKRNWNFFYISPITTGPTYIRFVSLRSKERCHCHIYFQYLLNTHKVNDDLWLVQYIDLIVSSGWSIICYEMKQSYIWTNNVPLNIYLINASFYCGTWQWINIYQSDKFHISIKWIHMSNLCWIPALTCGHGP